jgi:hypothetical protein
MSITVIRYFSVQRMCGKRVLSGKGTKIIANGLKIAGKSCVLQKPIFDATVIFSEIIKK